MLILPCHVAVVSAYLKVRAAARKAREEEHIMEEHIEEQVPVCKLHCAVLQCTLPLSIFALPQQGDMLVAAACPYSWVQLGVKAGIGC